ncbi:putative DNA binding protein motif protein [Ranid herpesvirus 3]|uniref:Putative DNA binding protein motif protein n=1 Tax=Ranid herpesvirus 3 TaxID=1987509 RepID=A0A1X9T5B3_9VIRU|nr:putative DNA binding protein motif protein [Ranid herpesvirus 3]ARR28886.1 putative DNA binding protein motif protein [Ranid herpesvirus 3]
MQTVKKKISVCGLTTQHASSNTHYNIYTGSFSLRNVVQQPSVCKINAVHVKVHVSDPGNEPFAVNGFGYLAKEDKPVTGPTVYIANQKDITIPAALCYSTGGGDPQFTAGDNQHRIAAQYLIGKESELVVSDILLYNAINLKLSCLDTLLLPALHELEQCVNGTKTLTTTCTCGPCNETNVPVACSSDFIALPLFHPVSSTFFQDNDLFTRKDYVQTDSALLNLCRALYSSAFLNIDESTKRSNTGHHLLVQSLIDVTMAEAKEKSSSIDTFRGRNHMQFYRITQSEKETPSIFLIKNQNTSQAIDFLYNTQQMIKTDHPQEKAMWVLSTRGLKDFINSLIVLRSKLDLVLMCDDIPLQLIFCSRTLAKTLYYDLSLEIEFFPGVTKVDNMLPTLYNASISQQQVNGYASLSNTIITFPMVY